MKGVNTEVIAEVRNRAKIVEIVSELVVLKRAGKDYKGLCPFHSEKSPSFFVNPDKGIFKCFGCGEGGDVFAFVQKTRRIDFIDSVKELAQKTGVQLIESKHDQEEYDKRSAMLMLYQQAAEYFHHLLEDEREGALARDYLHRRGIDEETISRFKLGYAPSAWDGLLRYLSDANKVAAETLMEAGLVRRKPDSNHFYDLFRNRLMIPIQDEQGRVIAFGGRTMGDDQIKYINSPESAIYTKGEHLFALHQAKESIKEKDSVIVVEGYFDAITAHRYGFRNTVATLGTALTERQGKLLVRFTERKRVYLCFDSDAAGEKAVARGMETLTNIAEGIGIEMRVIRVPGGKDPDESLRSKDPEAGVAGFQNCIEKAPLLIDYKLESAISTANVSTHSGRIEAAKLIVPILGEIKNAVARGEYIRQWSMRLGIREEDLLTDVGQYRRQHRMGGRESESVRPQVAKNAPKAGGSEAELSILSLYLLSRQDYDLLKRKLQFERMSDPVFQRIKEALESIDKFNESEEFWQNLQDKLAPDAEASQRLWDLATKSEEIKKQNLPISVILNDCESRLIRERLIRAMNALSMQIKQKPSEEEELKLSLKISQLTRLQHELQRSPEGVEEVKRKLEALLVETKL
ncbi:MAG: DNA primase [Candidatus Obscuribacterales bacterium]|nr:DNA primase [Candidatus Obscuribacterales bacterium]